MKTKSIFILAVAMLFNWSAFAQLNMTALEQPQSQLGNLQVLGKSDFDVDKYFMPADSIIFNNQHYDFKVEHNPIGKLFYVIPKSETPLDSIARNVALYVNHDSKTKGYKQLESDYYEVIGCIRFKEQFDKHMETMETYQIVENEDMFKDFAQIFKRDTSKVYLPLIADYERRVLIDKNSEYRSSPFWLMRSKKGDIFYFTNYGDFVSFGKKTEKVPYYKVFGKPMEEKATDKVVEDRSKWFFAARDLNTIFVSVPFYEQLCNDIKGQEVLIVSKEEFMYDARTNAPFKSICTEDPFRKCEYNTETGEISYPEIKYCKCVNVYVSDGEVFGQFEYEGARFTLPIPDLLNNFKAQMLNYTPNNWNLNPNPEKKVYGRRNREYYGVDNYDYFIVSRKRVEEIKATELEEFRFEIMSKENQRLAREKQMAEDIARYKKEKQEYIAGLVAMYGEEYGNLIADRKVAIGMTEEMCRKAWGRPHDIYNTTTKWGVSSVWVYNYKTYLYFYNGELKQIDN